ncbi:asparagine synthase-related protein [Halobellus salinisoli]|uniref:asparagine synthase-related protein n=1 Tax=Halobellus salinisoli TaxID=3108500 RepID=UPI00300865DE
MNKELFGVLDGDGAFDDLVSRSSFDWATEGERATVAIRDPALGFPGRSATYHDERGHCVLWGEVYPPDGVSVSAAEYTLDRYAAVGTDAFSELNGSFLVFVEFDDDVVVATDPVRSWQCFYTDTADGRVFGTNPHRVLSAASDPNVDTRGLLEYVHMGVVVGDRTVYKSLKNVPFDGYITADDAGTLSRFVYDPADPEEFDYVSELASRLKRAIGRRTSNPGSHGVLLSGGYDSRALVAQHPDIDICYTLGSSGHPEVEVAKRIAHQYGAAHETLVANDEYLNVDKDVIEYSIGTRESIHIHHAGCDDKMTVDTIFHGLLFDTFLRGHFLPRNVVDIFGNKFPLDGLDPDPDPTEVLSSKFGYHPACDHVFPECYDEFDTSMDFIDDVVCEQLDKWSERYDNVYDSIALVGIQNQPSVPFHFELADNYVESFVAVDAELLEWHLKTPPEERNTETVKRAMRKLNPNIFRHQPPDRPHHSFQKNQIEKFLRKKLPGLEPFSSPWPDMEAQYEQNELDRKLFPKYPSIHDLPVRVKLRINDITTWMNAASDENAFTPDDVLCPRSRLSMGI